MSSSAKNWCIVSFNAVALARSVPNGFSTMIRAPFARPAPSMPLAIRPKRNGGTSR
jgi:hypothetical protein